MERWQHCSTCINQNLCLCAQDQIDKHNLDCSSLWSQVGPYQEVVFAVRTEAHDLWREAFRKIASGVTLVHGQAPAG